MHKIIGYNLPGYIPDMEPFKVENREMAITQLIQMMKDMLEENDNATTYDYMFNKRELEHIREQIRLMDAEEIAGMFMGHVFWMRNA